MLGRFVWRWFAIPPLPYGGRIGGDGGVGRVVGGEEAGVSRVGLVLVILWSVLPPFPPSVPLCREYWEGGGGGRDVGGVERAFPFLV